MTASIVSIVAVCGYALTVLLMYRMFRGRERAWERKEQQWAAERKELLDRVMFMADKPWSPPPHPPETSDPLVEEPFFYPEQMLP